MRWLRYYWGQIKQAHAKRRKDTSFRAVPFVDAILAATALPPSAYILCLGPRNGKELDVWNRRGYLNVIGLDLLPTRDRRIRWGDMHRMPFPGDTFDCLYASHCFEHAWDFRQVAAEVVRVLKVGGWLFAAFPINFVPSSHDRICFGSVGGFLSDGAFVHTEKVWSRETPSEVSILLRLRNK